MAARRFTAETVLRMLDGEPDEEAIEMILSLKYLMMMTQADYVAQDQAGDVGVSSNPALLDEEDIDDIGDSSDEASEEETQTQSNRLSKKGSYWNENPLTPSRTRSHNILRLRSCPGPTPGSRAVSPKDAWDMFISNNIIEEVIKCTNLEGRRAAAGGQELGCGLAGAVSGSAAKSNVQGHHEAQEM